MDSSADILSLMPNINKEFDMHLIDNRLKTFADWPFKENCACTPEKLAAAGFVFCGSAQEPDLVKCYVCLKELDGWEPEDDPWNEHVKHSNNCPFIKHNNIAHTTVKEFLEMEQARVLKHADKYIRNSNSVWSERLWKIQEWLASASSDK